MADKGTLLSVFQRDLNRCLDNDRLTKKKGLEKLLKDLPWDDKSKRMELVAFLLDSVLNTLCVTLSDQVEKCRELTLSLLKKTLIVVDDKLTFDTACVLIQKLSNRVNDVPFLEPAEELRLQVVEVIQMVVVITEKYKQSAIDTSPIFEIVLNAMTKALTDSFPKVKDACAKLICSIASSCSLLLRSNFKSLLKGLAVNALHQHSKTRNVSLRAIGCGMTAIGTEMYETLMEDTVLHLFSRLIADHNANVRIELSAVCGDILSQRITHCIASNAALVKMDLEVAALLLLLSGDELEEVAQKARSNLRAAVLKWRVGLVVGSDTSMGQFSEGSQILDGEVEMKAVTTTVNDESAIDDISADDSLNLEKFIQANIRDLSDIMLLGVDSWTVDAKVRSIRGLEQFIILCENKIGTLLSLLLQALGSQIRDDEVNVRTATDQCCRRLGTQCDFSDVLDILLPRVNGEVPGGDTYGQRTNALRLLTQTLMGYPQNNYSVTEETATTDDDMMKITVEEITPSQSILCISNSLAKKALYSFREAVTREASLLLVRTIIQLYPTLCSSDEMIQKNLVLSLVFLCGRCPNEDDVVREFAHRELVALAVICIDDRDGKTEDDLCESLLTKHYEYLFSAITDSSSTAVVTNNPNWEPHSPAKSAFDVLIRMCPTESWRRHIAVISVITLQVQPKTGPAAGSVEANALNYAAQRGEELIPLSTDVDVRLSLLALLEGLIRSGSTDWAVSKHIADSAEKVVKEILVPNLIWRVGKVEATIRKVAMATAYALLKAGGVTYDTLFKVASELVPLLVSNLDDHEVTPRLITCLCLTVVFERLRGAFGETSIREIYPKLLARLDDSADNVRIAVCGTMTMFLQCAPPNAYSGTTIDYTLDQLFIHLDDPDPSVQQAVFNVILTGAKLDKALVLRKAESNRMNHRSPVLCDRLVVEIQGFEILEE